MYITYTTCLLELLNEEQKAAIRYRLNEESLVELKLSRETFGEKEWIDEDISECTKNLEENRAKLDSARADIRSYFNRFGIGCQYAEFGN